jgi:molecular chaperone Hsp33
MPKRELQTVQAAQRRCAYLREGVSEPVVLRGIAPRGVVLSGAGAVHERQGNRTRPAARTAIFAAMAMDEMVLALSEERDFRVCTVVGSSLVQEAARRHATSPLATLALGRALLGAILLASGNEEGESLQLDFRGDGPLRGVTAIADHAAGVRGFPKRRDAVAARGAPSLEVGPALGRGNLSVVRWRPSWREPYTGIVKFRSGEIADELAQYLGKSEQRRSAIALGVLLDPETRTGHCAGYLVEALPGASAAAESAALDNTRLMPNPALLLREGADAADLAQLLLVGLGHREIARREPRFFCSCSRERAVRSARLLGGEELRELRELGEALEIRCEFCNECYSVEADEVERYEAVPGRCPE